MNAPKQDHESKPDGEEASLPAVSANTLARCLGVSPKIVYDLTKSGIIERGAGRLYPLEDSVRRYCDYLRRQHPRPEDRQGLSQSGTDIKQRRLDTPRVLALPSSK
jgi:hypothetical protein